MTTVGIILLGISGLVIITAVRPYRLIEALGLQYVGLAALVVSTVGWLTMLPALAVSAAVIAILRMTIRDRASPGEMSLSTGPFGVIGAAVALIGTFELGRTKPIGGIGVANDAWYLLVVAGVLACLIGRSPTKVGAGLLTLWSALDVLLEVLTAPALPGMVFLLAVSQICLALAIAQVAITQQRVEEFRE